MGCVPVPDTGGAAVSETCCGGPVYAEDMTVSAGRMGAVKRTAPGDSANCPGVWSHLDERFDNDR